MKKVTTDVKEIQKIIRDYYKQLYTNKMDNLEEMDKFLERFSLPRLNQEERENIHKSSTSTEMETHSSVLAWRILGTEERGRPWSMGSQRVRHD